MTSKTFNNLGKLEGKAEAHSSITVLSLLLGNRSFAFLDVSYTFPNVWTLAWRTDYRNDKLWCLKVVSGFAELGFFVQSWYFQ